MKALFIGGTGTISMAITRSLAKNPNWELYLLNRGSRSEEIPEGVKVITADINDEAAVAAKLEGMKFDTVCDFIGFELPSVERDYRLFKDKTKQYMYISSASAYNKPCSSPFITEGTALVNPYWEYSRNKIACEHFLREKFEKEGFPITIIRPSHTYDNRRVPMGVEGPRGPWQNIKRMLEGKPVIMHGDGTSLWHMTYNEDLAKGFIGLMGNPHAIGEAFQITNDEVLTWNQIYQAIADALGVEYKPYYVSTEFLAQVAYWDLGSGMFGDKSHSVIFDCSKLKKAVPEFVANVRFDQGARIAIQYMLTHPEQQIEDPEYDAWCDKVIAAQEAAKKSVLG